MPTVRAPPSPSYAPPGLLACPTPDQPGGARYHLPEEECAFGPACWLWDYLRRSGAGGFFLPLSGGADSASVAAIVGTMCELVAGAVKAGDVRVAAEAARVTKLSGTALSDPKALANAVLHTVT